MSNERASGVSNFHRIIWWHQTQFELLSHMLRFIKTNEKKPQQMKIPKSPAFLFCTLVLWLTMALSRPCHSYRGKRWWKSKTVKGTNQGQERILILMNQAAFYKGKLTSNPSQTWFKHAFNAFFSIITFTLKLNTQGSVLLSHTMLLRFHSLFKPWVSHMALSCMSLSKHII